MHLAFYDSPEAFGPEYGSIFAAEADMPQKDTIVWHRGDSGIKKYRVVDTQLYIPGPRFWGATEGQGLVLIEPC